MIQVRLVVRDRERDLSGTCHGSDADRLIAALSAEPETIAELAAAGRFMELRGSTLRLLPAGCSLSPLQPPAYNCR